MRDDRSAFEVIGGVAVVTAPEEIDVTNAEALRSDLLAAAAHGPGTLVVDMTVTGFVIRQGFIPCWRRTIAPRLKAVSCCCSSPTWPSCVLSGSPALTA